MNVTTTLDIVTCWCGITYAIPHALHAEANRNGMAVRCPIGHEWVSSDPEFAKLKKELAQTRDARDRALRQRDDEQKAHAATKGQLTRARKEQVATKCPCCQRTFSPVGMSRHIKSKHPDWQADGQAD